jgi:hypothetical protein
VVSCSGRQDSQFLYFKKTVLYSIFATIFLFNITAAKAAMQTWDTRHKQLIVARHELPDICSGNYDIIRRLYPRPERLEKLLPYFERYFVRNGISIDFQPKNLQDYQMQEPEVVAGWVRWSARNVAAKKFRDSCIEFTGWAVDLPKGRPAKAVLLVSHGKIVKTGIVGQRRQDVARYLKNENYASSGWSIFVRQDRLPEDESSYEVYAVMNDGVRIVKLRKHPLSK